MSMTAFEAFVYSVDTLRKHDAARQQVKAGAVKFADLPQELKDDMLNEEFTSNLKAAQKKAAAALREELKGWI
jgi:hypothetical protein